GGGGAPGVGGGGRGGAGGGRGGGGRARRRGGGGGGGRAGAGGPAGGAVPAVVALAAEVDAIVRHALEVHRHAARALAHAQHEVGPRRGDGARQRGRHGPAVHGQHHGAQAQGRVRRGAALQRTDDARAGGHALAAEGFVAGEQDDQRPAHVASRS